MQNCVALSLQAGWRLANPPEGAWVCRRMWGWFGHIPWSLVGINSTFVGSSWPPDVLVLLWPTLFSGDERGGVDQQTGQRILEVTLFVLADAGLLQLLSLIHISEPTRPY